MSDKKVKINFFGGVGHVTGSNFLLEASSSKILVDCGLFQETVGFSRKNDEPFPYDPSLINFLFITHGHLDHIGRIPRLVAKGFRGKILSTPETKEISKLILEDALKVASYKDKNNKSGENGEEKHPLYSKQDLEKTFELWETLSYGETFKIDSHFEAVFRNAGHILGSAMVEFKFSGQSDSIVFTGDLGSWPNPLLQKTDNLPNVKYLVMESVYGDRNQSPAEERGRMFRDVVEKTIKKGGTLLIPSFSLERAQVILFELNKLVEDKKIPALPVFFDSPLAIRLLEIYKKSKHLFNEEARKLIEDGDDLFNFPGLVISKDSSESRSIKDVLAPKIIIAGSGMSQGGRIVFHEAEYLPHKENTLLLVGYQAVGTLGRSLEEGVSEVEIKDKKIKVMAEIEHIDSFSAHKDSDNLLEFVHESGDSLEKVFLVMGEPKASLFLAQKIKDNLDIPCLVPEEGKEYYLEL